MPNNLIDVEKYIDRPIKYIHLRWDDLNGTCVFGGVTIAYQQTQDNNYRVAYARCNDRDHYCKRIGRNISSGRLLSGDCYQITIPTFACRYTEMVRYVNEKIQRHMYNAGASHQPFPDHE